ncbi:TIGR04222 domain-containing membrane protein [Streptomyces sp. NPDC001514]
MQAETWWFAGTSAVLLAAAAALLRSRTPEDLPELSQQAVALLRGGRRAALTVALVALHQRGAVAPGRRGTVQKDGAGRGGTRDPLQRAVLRALPWPVGVRMLASHALVQRAIDDVEDEPARLGLLRTRGRWRTARALLVAVPATMAAGLSTAPPPLWAPAQWGIAALPVLGAAGLWCVPRRTRSGRRLLASLRERHPLPASRHGCPPGQVQLAVALYGEPALMLFVPHFARDGGLLGAGSLDHGDSRDYAARELDGDWSGP